MSLDNDYDLPTLTSKQKENLIKEWVNNEPDYFKPLIKFLYLKTHNLKRISKKAGKTATVILVGIIGYFVVEAINITFNFGLPSIIPLIRSIF